MTFNKFVLILIVILLVFVAIAVIILYYEVNKPKLKYSDYQKIQAWNKHVKEEQELSLKREKQALKNWLSDLDKKTFRMIVAMILVHYYRTDIKNIKDAWEIKNKEVKDKE